MKSLFKEGKKIVHSYTKCAQLFEVANEVAGYAHAVAAGVRQSGQDHPPDSRVFQLACPKD